MTDTLDSFEKILLQVWQEACRHIEIGESTSNIAQLLAQHMPLAQLVVRRIEWERKTLETVALGFPDAEHEGLDSRKDCSDEEMTALTKWGESGEPVLSGNSASEKEPWSAGVPVGIETPVLIGPLLNQGQLAGLLVAATHMGSFSSNHLEMFRALLEPFSVALENDHRLREMAALQEAAEADRRALLTRLGRQDLGDTIIGAESGLRLVMERVALVSRSDVPVLILGETGTGKELVARAIHRRSGRSNGPIIRVNCGAIPPELVDSQLFGHERGAFTGAVEKRKGWFERADGGTLFLDEIGELPLAAQVRLLRILQDGWLERIGGHQPIKVDVRIVAATHRDPLSMVSEGRFREDLWYRIAVFPILLPPLRDRPEDVPALARHFAERAALRFGLPVLTPAAEDIRLLTSYSWPGNVRELGTVMDRAAILGDGHRLEIAKALGVMNLSPSSSPVATGTGTAPTADIPLMSLDDAMRRHIEAVLKATHGRVEGRDGTADILKINPHTLRARMRKLGVRWTDFRKE